jgi:hypothetical protein
LIGELGFGLALIAEEKNKKEPGKMLKELKLGVPHPKDNFLVSHHPTKLDVPALANVFCRDSASPLSAFHENGVCVHLHHPCVK